MPQRITCFLLTDGPVTLNAEALQSALAQGGWAVDPTPPAAMDAGATVLMVDGHMVMLMAQPFAVPAEDLQPLVPHAWMWEQAAEVVEAHQGHLIVSIAALDDELPQHRLAAALTLATVAALCSGDPRITAVVWDGVMLRRPDYYNGVIDQQAALAHLPTHAVDHRFLRREDPNGRGPEIEFITAGLVKFIGQELHMGTASGLKPSEMLDLSAAMTGYLLDQGPVIEDGNTFDGPHGLLRAQVQQESGVTLLSVAAAQ